MMMRAMMMRTMSRQSRQGSLAGAAGGSDLMSMLTPLLDFGVGQNRNGSLVDDVTGMLGRFLGSR
jgi:hypothetical protein